MNDEMFFYPLYPFDGMGSGYSDIDDSYRGNSNLFTPEETMQYGNLFKNQYVGYKNYQPYKINIPNKECVLNLVAMGDYVHDLKLYLDIYPNDKKMLALYKDAKKRYKELSERISLEKLPCPVEGIGEIKMDSPIQNLWRGEIDV